MKVERIVKIKIEEEEKKTVCDFDKLINSLCSSMDGECEICPIKKQCNHIADLMVLLKGC